ncbi:calcium-binding protein [Thermococcus sp.]|uniref:calcium-binding protein n=1 Tax=Thermococcus sp. TaxID=35749 RepID=UPI002608E125|nr:calcium-binding protein [Thermococcus sp.]
MRKVVFLLFLILLTSTLNVTTNATAQNQSMYIDTDGDGLTDRDEVNVYNTHPGLFDTDGDGLGDGEEVLLGTNPLVKDTDVDGLWDGEEIAIGTSPLLKDTDGDGLTDYAEVVYIPEKYNLTPPNPLDPDTDDDGMSDGMEWERWHVTFKFPEGYLNPDKDGDGIRDGAEVYTFTWNGELYTYYCDVTPDCDMDMLSDAEELELGTSPVYHDTDGDGLLDILELRFGSSPFKKDTDGDGLSDFEEVFPLLAYEYKLTEDISSIVGREPPEWWDESWKGLFIGPLNTTYICVPTMEELEQALELNRYPMDVVRKYIRTGLHSYLSNVYTQDYAERYRKGDVYSDNAVCYLGIPTDPTKYDTDGDGLSDYEELNYHLSCTDPGCYLEVSWLMLDPNDPDSDGDGIIDSLDIVPVNYDIDGDKLIEQDTCAYFTDCDGDGLYDYWEHLLKTDPKNPDTDGDGLTDYEEAGSVWSNLDENGTPHWIYSDPLNPDTDGDGFTDFEEHEGCLSWWDCVVNPDLHPNAKPNVQKPEYNKTEEIEVPPRKTWFYNATVKINGRKLDSSIVLLETDSFSIEVEASPLKVVMGNKTIEKPVQKIYLLSQKLGNFEVQGDTFSKTFTLENFTEIGIEFLNIHIRVDYGNFFADLNYDLTFKYKALPEVKLDESTWDENLDVGKLVFECRFCKNATIIVPGALVNGKKKRVIELGRTTPLKYIYARIIPHRYTIASESDVGTIYTKYENSVEVLKTGKDIGLLTAKAVEAKSLGSKIIYGMVATAKGIKTIIGGVEAFIPEDENAEVEKPEGVDTPTSAKFDKEAFKKGLLNWIKEKLIDATFDYVTQKAVEYADAKELEARRHKTTYHVTVKACNDFGCKVYSFTVEGYAYDFD